MSAKEPLQSWRPLAFEWTLVKGGSERESAAVSRTYRAGEHASSIIASLRLEEKSNEEHLESIKAGIELFLKKAEIKL